MAEECRTSVNGGHAADVAAADLDHILTERYANERLTDDFHERYIDACIPGSNT
jgi:hypothetical protein